MTKAKEMLYPIGVEDLYIAMMTGGRDAIDEIPTYESEIYRIPTIETIGLQGNQTNTTRWASNKNFVNATKNSTHTITLDHLSLPVEVMDKIQGLVASKGITFETAEIKEYPLFALGFITPLSTGEKMARWYPRVQIAPPQETYKTSTEETDIPTQQLVMTATPLLINDVTKVDFNSAREGSTGVTAEQFMAQVVVDESQLETLFSSAG